MEFSFHSGYFWTANLFSLTDGLFVNKTVARSMFHNDIADAQCICSVCSVDVTSDYDFTVYSVYVCILISDEQVRLSIKSMFMFIAYLCSISQKCVLFAY